MISRRGLALLLRVGILHRSMVNLRASVNWCLITSYESRLSHRTKYNLTECVHGHILDEVVRRLALPRLLRFEICCLSSVPKMPRTLKFPIALN
jgi:hypothetical protein